MTLQTLFDLLQSHAENDRNGITAYAEHANEQTSRMSYASLRRTAEEKSSELRSLPQYRKKAVVLLHFTEHVDNIVWFWAVLVAGCIPALSTPLPNNIEQRNQHLSHLDKLFDHPMVLTRKNLADLFRDIVPLTVYPVEDLALKSPISDRPETPPLDVRPDSLAALMLTSGSTGNAKAVCLTHGQMLTSVRGKATVVNLTRAHSYLNWVGIDHVGALMECHLLALYEGLDQIHVQPTDLITDPIRFLRLIARHHVGRTFAPNFFLASLLKAAARNPDQLKDIDIQCLKFLTSGGEANPINTCVEVSRLLTSLQAKEPVLSPAFGMTETCAGAIYNTECPKFDCTMSMQFASLGSCVPGIEMRVVPIPDSTDTRRGSLQVRGPIVTSGYYKNTAATLAAFTADGWFDTGDEAMIDDTGHLHMTGRIKEHVRINGISIIPTDLENGLNHARIPGTVDNYFVCFGFRPERADTEHLAVLYLASYELTNRQARRETISRNILNQCSVSPYVLPLDIQMMEKSTLGKLSRGKLKNAFTEGKLRAYCEQNDQAMRQHQATNCHTLTGTQRNLLAILHDTLAHEIDPLMHSLTIYSEFFEMGITSVHLILIRRHIMEAMGIVELPIIVLLANTTVQSLAAVIDRQLQQSWTVHSREPNAGYMPVVKLRKGGSKNPIWLFHPGVGEVLVFLGLAKHLNDRPVYAIRARGFENGETFFSCVDEAVNTYYQSIKMIQPSGPYALAGYSYGAMLAFETGKKIEANNGRVAFLGSFNLPPHIKNRMLQLDYTACCLHLGYFLDLITERQAQLLSLQLRDKPQYEIVERIFEDSAAARLEELGLSKPVFEHWANLAYNMQTMARTYEPKGRISLIDVFYCQPLSAVATDKTNWLADHLSKWSDFCCTNVQFHEVDGAHYTMINEDHVASFAEIFENALVARGL